MLTSHLSIVPPAPLDEQFTFEAAKSRRVLLMCPPYQALRQASLAIAHLATWLRTQGQVCAEAYVHFDFARCFGKPIYDKVVNLKTALVGELIFAEALHSCLENPQANQHLYDTFGDEVERRRSMERYATLCLQHVRDFGPDVVGCTTSFNQLLPSLWLARIIKREFPQTFFVLGGATCAEPMAHVILEAYPEVDCVVSGFGEYPLLKLAQGATPKGRLLTCDAFPEFDSLPIPAYEATLSQAAEFADLSYLLSFESSRGCWWGEKNHCSFCGLNGNEMRFTKKTSARVVHEIRTLWERYGRDMSATDNILARDHLGEAIRELGRFSQGPTLSYEIKTNLSEGDIAALRRARVGLIQPGIESLNTRLLRLLKKGTTTIRNLLLLKWCREYQIMTGWNLLCGIPGESFEDYDQQLLLIDAIPHFEPPVSMNPLRIDRYSPYFKNHADYGWQRLEPFEEYEWLHPQLDPTSRYDLAYHFKGLGGVVPGPYLKRMRSAVATWRERFARDDGLFYDPKKGLIRNELGQGFSYGRNPVLERVISATNDIRAIDQVAVEVGCERSQLEKLAKGNILYIEGNKVINLAVRTEVDFAESTFEKMGELTE